MPVARLPEFIVGRELQSGARKVEAGLDSICFMAYASWSVLVFGERLALPVSECPKIRLLLPSALSLLMAMSGPPGSRRPSSAFGWKADVHVAPAGLPLLTRFGSSRSWPDTKAAARCPPPLVLGEVSSGNPSAHYVAETGEADGEQGERARFRDRHWRRPQQRRGHGQEMPRRSRCRGCRDRGSRNSHPILGWGHPLSAALGQGRRRQPTARRSCPRRTGR